MELSPSCPTVTQELDGEVRGSTRFSPGGFSPHGQCQPTVSPSAITARGCPQLQSQLMGVPECNDSLWVSAVPAHDVPNCNHSLWVSPAAISPWAPLSAITA